MTQQTAIRQEERLTGSLERGLAILHFLADHDPVTVADLVANQDVHRSTIVRVLHTLEAAGYVARVDANRWTLGSALVEIGARALGELSLRDHAIPAMQRLAETTDESVQLCIRSGDDMFVVEVVESSQAVRVGLPLGHRAPLYCTATGKAILASLSDSDVTAYVERVLFQPQTSRTIVDPDAFRADLARVRELGYATNDEEHFEGVRFVGAPIVDRRGRAIAAMVLGGPSIRFTQDDFPRLGRLVRQAADEVSRAIRLRGMRGAQGTGKTNSESPH